MCGTGDSDARLGPRPGGVCRHRGRFGSAGAPVELLADRRTGDSRIALFVCKKSVWR